MILRKAAPHLHSAVQGKRRLGGRQRCGLAAGRGGGHHEHHGGPHQDAAGATDFRQDSLCPPHIQAAHLCQARCQHKRRPDRATLCGFCKSPDCSVF